METIIIAQGGRYGDGKVRLPYIPADLNRDLRSRGIAFRYNPKSLEMAIYEKDISVVRDILGKYFIVAIGEEEVAVDDLAALIMAAGDYDLHDFQEDGYKPQSAWAAEAALKRYQQKAGQDPYQVVRSAAEAVAAELDELGRHSDRPLPDGEVIGETANLQLLRGQVVAPGVNDEPETYTHLWLRGTTPEGRASLIINRLQGK